MCRTGLPLWRTRCALKERAAEPLYLERDTAGLRLGRGSGCKKVRGGNRGCSTWNIGGGGRDKIRITDKPRAGQPPGLKPSFLTRERSAVFENPLPRTKVPGYTRGSARSGGHPLTKIAYSLLFHVEQRLMKFLPLSDNQDHLCRIRQRNRFQPLHFGEAAGSRRRFRGGKEHEMLFGPLHCDGNGRLHLLHCAHGHGVEQIWFRHCFYPACIDLPRKREDT